MTNPVSLRFIVCRMFLLSTRSVQLIFSIFLHHHISKFSRQFWSTFRRIQFSVPHKAMREIWHFTNTIKLNMHSVWHGCMFILLSFYYWLLVSGSKVSHQANIYKKHKMLVHIVQKVNFMGSYLHSLVIFTIIRSL